MSEAKPFASLTSGLLARKGAARPAMRRQLALGSEALDHAMHDDLGWNDMGEDDGYREETRSLVRLTPMQGPAHAGEEPGMPGARLDHQPAKVAPIDPATPVPAAMAVPPVVEQRDILAEKMAGPAAAGPVDDSPAAAARPRKAKAAFTLRLDPERHLRLRLACAVGNRSAQQVVTLALDAFLAAQPGLDALADRAARESAGKN